MYYFFHLWTKVHQIKRVKGLDIYTPPLTGKPEQQRFTMQSGVLTGNDTGGAAQLVAAHCPNERTHLCHS